MPKSSVSHPVVTADSGVSCVGDAHEGPEYPAAGACSLRKRPQGVMRHIRFAPCLWVVQALKSGLFPTPQAHTVATIIADAADTDGRWCFLYQDTIIGRCGQTLSLSTLKRSINDLVDVGLVRKLSTWQARSFFHADIDSGRRWADKLPMVLELMIPASAFPEQVLEEINQVRAEMGEEPLTAESRPYPSVATTVPSELAPSSQRTTDPSPNNPSSNNLGPSVRRSSSTDRAPAREVPDGPGVSGGGGVRREPRGRALEFLARVPDAALRDPGPDRAALTQAMERLLEEGLEASESAALLKGSETLVSPFPALMRRLKSVKDARRFLDGRLGAGVHHPGVDVSSPRWGGIPMPRCGQDSANSGGKDMFAWPEEFVVDVNGAAPRTCPDHPGVRNVPGGDCRACGGLCRSVPGEILHPPAPTTAEPEPLTKAPVFEVFVEETELDPVLGELMRASLDQSRRKPASPNRTADLTPAVRAALSAVRERLAQIRQQAKGPAPGLLVAAGGSASEALPGHGRAPASSGRLLRPRAPAPSG